MLLYRRTPVRCDRVTPSRHNRYLPRAQVAGSAHEGLVHPDGDPSQALTLHFVTGQGLRSHRPEAVSLREDDMPGRLTCHFVNHSHRLSILTTSGWMLLFSWLDHGPM